MRRAERLNDVAVGGPQGEPSPTTALPDPILAGDGRAASPRFARHRQAPLVDGHRAARSNGVRSQALAPAHRSSRSPPSPCAVKRVLG
jgi:hypothetical protein